MEIPLFIKNRGCANCSNYEPYKLDHLKDNNHDCEHQGGCIISGCSDYGFSLVNHFVDPNEAIEEFRRLGSPPEYKENAVRYCEGVKKRFGDFYKEIGVSIEDLIKKI